MKTERTYKSIFRARATGAIAMARAASGITHSGLKGRVREILIKELFRPLLPSNVSITSGQITSCATGQLSRQQDIIVFDRSLIPPMSFDEDTAIIPVESVLYTIEIKSRLTKHELECADQSAEELAKLEYLPGRSFNGHQEVIHPTAKLNSTIFALDTDLAASENAEARRYKEICKSRPPNLKALCIVGRGYWFERNGLWVKVGGDLEGDEVLAFISGIMNTYWKISTTRGRYKIGEYLIDEGELSAISSSTTSFIKVKCEGCEQTAIAPLPDTNDNSIELDSDFVAQDPCDRCGKRYIAQPGNYVSNDGIFTKR